MKITKAKLKQIIKEELDTAITQEGFLDMFKGKAKETPEDKKLRQALIDLLGLEDMNEVPLVDELAQMRVDDERTYNALKGAVTGKRNPHGDSQDSRYKNTEMNQVALKAYAAWQETLSSKKAQSDSEEAANKARREKEKARTRLNRERALQDADAQADLEQRERDRIVARDRRERSLGYTRPVSPAFRPVKFGTRSE